MPKIFQRPVREEIAVIDSRFPRPLPYGFRTTEINELFKILPKLNSYTMYPMKPGDKAWFDHSYGMEKSEFEENKKGYLKYFPENESRIRYLDPKKKYKIRLAYSYFLAETYTLLPFYKANDIDFVFVLYPGGGFGLDNDSSDAMLKAIFASKNFKKVIVTKNVTYNYLIRKKLCSRKDIKRMHGYVQFAPSDIHKKRLYPNKKHFDICFVSAKYSDKGVDKGYDIFIEVAKIISKKNDDVHFHVIGGFDQNDFDVESLKSRIKFYGFKRPDFLAKFYSHMDILLSPNRAFKLYDGNFDGFPLGADAAYMGTALFVTDELQQNDFMVPGKEVEIINTNAKTIADRILYYVEHLDELYELSRRGQEAMQRTFNIEAECMARSKLFHEIIGY